MGHVGVAGATEMTRYPYVLPCMLGLRSARLSASAMILMNRRPFAVPFVTDYCYVNWLDVRVLPEELRSRPRGVTDSTDLS